MSDSNSNKISLSAAHAALDALGMAHAAPYPPNLLAQVTAQEAQPSPTIVEIPPVAPPATATNAAAAEASATDLLTLVRVKLNRVAVEFGIDYALVRDFFTSHL